MNYRDVDRLDLILRLIDDLHRRLDGIKPDQFLADRDEIDLTAYRLSVIGEASGKLADEIKRRHPHIGWGLILGMRNIIVHDYEGVIAERLWSVFQYHIDLLAAVCRQELDEA